MSFPAPFRHAARTSLPLLLLTSLGANAPAGGDLGLCSALGPNYCAGRCGGGWSCRDEYGHVVPFSCGPCCTPATCQPGECGEKADGCGGTLDCGACCTPLGCRPGDCGTLPDGCGGTIDCGACPYCGDLVCQEHCTICPGDCGACDGSGGSLGLCSALPDDRCRGRCGPWTCEDGSGHTGTISCPACPCEPLTCRPDECGSKADGCGGTLDCGCCPRGCGPADCGTLPDGCGGTIDCGACPSCGDQQCQEHCSVCPQDCGACTPGNGASLGSCDGATNPNLHCRGRCGDWTCEDANHHPVRFSCPACPCTALTCQPGDCGTRWDGCSGQIECGSCPSGEVCGPDNRCQQAPPSCDEGGYCRPCRDECTEVVATCLTPCELYPPPPAAPRVANCAAYASMYPDEDNACAYCDPGVCTTASVQAQITCAPRGGTAQIVCDSERNEWARMVCSDGWQCTLDCDGDTHLVTTPDCGPMCPDGQCEEGLEDCRNCWADCGYCPSPSNGLTVVTYNIQMLPESACVPLLGSSCFSAERAPLIAEHLAPFHADVIVLEEAFVDGPRALLLMGLRSEYPYQTRVLNAHVTRLQNGGVVILSRWPIRFETDLLYSACSGSIIDGGATDVDCFSAKGVKYALIEKDGRLHHVFGTHTDAGDDFEDRVARQQQLGEMFRFVSDRVRSFASAAGRPIQMAGDFNIDSRGPDYLSMLSALWAGAPTRIPESGVTNQSGEWIDYVLYGKSWPQYGHPQEPLESSNVVHEVTETDGRLPARYPFAPNLSDHHLVRGVFLYAQAGPTANTGGAVASAGAAVGEPSGSAGDPPGSEACPSRIRLAAPTLVAPAGDVDQDVQTFSWDPVMAAESYRLRVVDLETDGPVLDVAVRENVFTPTAFAVPDRSYRWSVVARRGAAESPEAQAQFTYRETAIPAPVALAPSGSVAGTYPRFSWGLVPGALYVLTVTDAETGDEVLKGIAPPGSFLTAGKPLSSGRRYRWTVRAVRGSRTGPESEPLEFTCAEGASLDPPEPLEPRGRIEGSPAAFSWTAVPGAEAYQVDVVAVQDGATVLSRVVADTSLAPSASLSPGLYRWSVRALAGDVAGRESLTLLVHVLAANRPPTVAITSCGECAVPCALTLTAEAVDADGDELRYSWSGCASGELPTATCSLTQPGPATATVTVTDGRGGTETVSVTLQGALLLTVTRSGDGLGTVTSSPAGIDCGSTCSASYSSGTAVSLVPTPSSVHSTFAGWGGACTGTGVCTVTMDGGKAVAAAFDAVNRPPTVSVSISRATCHPTPSAPCTATCAASASDPDGDPLTYAWSGCAGGTGSTATCAVPDLTTRICSVTVGDGHGATAVGSKSVTGVNSPPSCVANDGASYDVWHLSWTAPIGLSISDPDGDAIAACTKLASDASHRIAIGSYQHCLAGPPRMQFRPACSNMPTVANVVVTVGDGWTSSTCQMPTLCFE